MGEGVCARHRPQLLAVHAASGEGEGRHNGAPSNQGLAAHEHAHAHSPGIYNVLWPRSAVEV